MTIDDEQYESNPEIEAIKLRAHIEARSPEAADDTQGGGEDEVGDLDKEHADGEGGRGVVLRGVVTFEQLAHEEELRHSCGDQHDSCSRVSKTLLKQQKLGKENTKRTRRKAGKGEGRDIPRIRIWKIARTRKFRSEVDDCVSQNENPTTKPTSNACRIRPTLNKGKNFDFVRGGRRV